MGLHVTFTLWAWRIMPVAAGLFAFASLQSTELPRKAGLVWMVLALLLAGYAAFLEFGPTVATLDGLTAQVLAQKTITVVVLAAFVTLARAVHGSQIA